MFLRFSSDRRTLVWAFVLFPLAPALAYLEPKALWFVTPFAFYLSYCAGVLTHNQTHCAVFREKRWNRLYSLWLSLFYGCPVFVWVPTHLANHHRYLNGEGDVARTTRHSSRNTALSALSTRFTTSSQGSTGAWLGPGTTRAPGASRPTCKKTPRSAIASQRTR